MNLLKVKDNEDFIFKFVILFLIFLFCYITIFLYYNYNYLFSYREGLETGEAYVVSKENKTDLGGGDGENDGSGDENTDENADQNINQQEEIIKVNPIKADLLKEVNLQFSNADGNRAKTLEKIEWFKNWNKGVILSTIYSSADSAGGINTDDVVNRLEINKAFETGEIDRLIASFPLTEAESNSMSSGSGSGSGGLF